MVTARLRVEVRDEETGKIIPARFYLTDSAGKPWAPAGAINYHKAEEHHFISTGAFQIELPPGPYTLTCERGPEWLPYTGSLEARGGEERSVAIPLKRWIDMNRLGWYSGDLHNHRPVAEMPQLLVVEDLNLAHAGRVDLGGSSQFRCVAEGNQRHPARRRDARLQCSR